MSETVVEYTLSAALIVLGLSSIRLLVQGVQIIIRTGKEPR